MQYVILAAIGFMAGISSGLFGIGGGTIIVPALVYFAGFTQHKATGTSLAVLLPPVGAGAVFEYYRKGNVDLQAAIVMAVFLLAGAWVSSIGANKLSGPALKISFGLFMVLVGVYAIGDAIRKLPHKSNAASPTAISKELRELRVRELRTSSPHYQYTTRT